RGSAFALRTTACPAAIAATATRACAAILPGRRETSEIRRLLSCRETFRTSVGGADSRAIQSVEGHQLGCQRVVNLEVLTRNRSLAGPFRQAAAGARWPPLAACGIIMVASDPVEVCVVLFPKADEYDPIGVEELRSKLERFACVLLGTLGVARRRQKQ